jgi:outer membrane murein-binding lipoprotein Lpp
MTKTACVALLTIAVLAGCGKDAPQNAQAQLTTKINELSTRLDQAEQEIIALKETVTTAPAANGSQNIAALLAGSQEQAMLETKHGILTLRLLSIKAAGNGSKVQLQIGNPLAGVISGFKFQLEYGKLDENGAIVEDSKKTREVSLSKKLNAGSWTTITINIDDTSSSELSYFFVTQPVIASMELREAK